MNKNIMYGITATFVVAVLLFSSFVIADGEEGDNYETEIDSVWASTPPTLDGVINEGEWDESAMTNIDFFPDPPHRNDTIYIYFMNDAEWLYIGVDLLPDNTTDEGDYVGAFFDEDNNGVFNLYAPQLEDYYAYGIANMSDDDDEYLVPMLLESSNGFMYSADFDTSVNDDDVDHRMWEFKIPLSNFKQGELELGDTIGVHLEGYGTLSPTWVYPLDTNYSVATDWAEITLAEEEVEPIEDGYTAEDYGVIMMGFGTVIAVLLTLFYKETELKWIGEGNMKAYLIAKGVTVALLLLGLLQYYYDWLSWLGL